MYWVPGFRPKLYLREARMSWTPDRVDLLKKLWAEGLSCSQIAGQLGGVTRNAVIGKRIRLGLPERRTVTKSRRKPSVKRPPQKKMSVPLAFQKDLMSSQPFTTKVFDPGNHKPVPIEDLHGLSCRWPFDDADGNHIGYCGCKKTGAAYCDFHARLAYFPTQKLEKKGERAA